MAAASAGRRAAGQAGAAGNGEPEGTGRWPVWAAKGRIQWQQHPPEPFRRALLMANVMANHAQRPLMVQRASRSAFRLKALSGGPGGIRTRDPLIKSRSRRFPAAVPIPEMPV